MFKVGDIVCLSFSPDIKGVVVGIEGRMIATHVSGKTYRFLPISLKLISKEGYENELI